MGAMFICLLFVGYNEVEGNLRSSKGDGLELKKQLKPRNKPSVKIIKTDYGDIYDCIDFFKQPAFDHPLLKNHTYHYKMKPQFLKEIRREAPLKRDEGSINIGLNESCPIGTVPIKRITKQDLITEKLLAQRLDLSGGIQYAVAQTRIDHKINYTGAEGQISMHNPMVSGQQYSTSRIQLQNDAEYIQFGWRVDETLYHDDRTYQFIAAHSGSQICYDLRCPFIVVSRTRAPGLAYDDEQISKPGGPDTDGNWWLLLGQNNLKAGFWPSKLFTKLSQYATRVEFGGAVYSPRFMASPAMGTGLEVSGNYNVDAFISRLQVTDTAGNNSDPDTDARQNLPFQYTAIDTVLRGRVSQEYAHIVFFGGPGG